MVSTEEELMYDSDDDAKHQCAFGREKDDLLAQPVNLHSLRELHNVGLKPLPLQHPHSRIYLKLTSTLWLANQDFKIDLHQVPFGSVAFMPGKLIHTNEILVLLGDNWFVERSAAQAQQIVQRRIGCELLDESDYWVTLIKD